MILNWIKLHNFMSYADATVDLASIGVACLSGDNGAGKSALLDAVGWALWERARAVSDDLIRLGESDMWIDLCFGFDSQIYRVRRARQRTYSRSGQRSSSKGSLEFQVFQGEGDNWRLASTSGRDPGGSVENPDSGWRSLTGSSMKETQERIIGLLNMDYDGFATSVCLRQGRADEFTLRSPSERKQVLSDILGLDRFARWQEAAREAARALKAEIQFLEANTSTALNLKEQIARSSAEEEEARERLQAKSEELRLVEARVKSIESELAELRYHQMRLDDLKRRRDELGKDLESLRRRCAELADGVSRAAAIMAKESDIRDAARDLESVKSECARLDGAAIRHHDLSLRCLELKAGLATERGRIEVELQHLRGDLAALAERKVKLEKGLKSRQELQAAYESYREQLARESELVRRKEAHSRLSERACELESMILQARLKLEAEIQQKTELIAELDRMAGAGDLLRQEKDELCRQADELDRLETEFELVEDRGIRAKSEIDAIESQIRHLKHHLRDNEEKQRELFGTEDLSTCPLCRAPIVDRLAVLERYRSDSTSTQREIAALEENKQQLEDNRGRLRHEYLELRRRLDERKALDVRIGEFNERQAALERAESTRQQLGRELEGCRRRLEEHAYAVVECESLVRIKAELSQLDYDPILFASLQSQIRAERHVEFRWQQLQRDAAELEKVEEEIPRAQEKIALLEGFLDNNSFAPEVRAKLAGAESELSSCSYDRDAHQEVRRRLASLLPAAEALQELERVVEASPALESSLDEMSASRIDRESELERVIQDLELAWQATARVADLDEELERLIGVRDSLRSESLLQERRLAGLEARLSQLETGRIDLEARQDRLALKCKELSDYVQLSDLLGKKGIQAVIIENAIPEIESEANRLLSRLTENQMHIALVTQQRTRQGAPVETLEIVIADDAGTRAYELYSGGEAFKINFAIRVSLARLLARRAGARLETLLIDEGFGSQDELSRVRLVRAIDSIKGDFARILVITHIQEVREMFPVQIAVSKEDGVSRLTVVS